MDHKPDQSDQSEHQLTCIFINMHSHKALYQQLSQDENSGNRLKIPQMDRKTFVFQLLQVQE